jgi:hypothetical protein
LFTADIKPFNENHANDPIMGVDGIHGDSHGSVKYQVGKGLPGNLTKGLVAFGRINLRQSYFDRLV